MPVRVPWVMFLRIQSDLIAHRSHVWRTSGDGMAPEGIPSEVKIMVCLRIIVATRSLQDLGDHTEMGKENIRYYSQKN